MDPTSQEPTLEEMLADPIIQLLMRSDNIVAKDVRQLYEPREACRRRGPLVEHCIGLVNDTLNGPLDNEGADRLGREQTSMPRRQSGAA